MRILIAEDDKMQRSILKALLSKAGHEIIETTDGKQAWQQLQSDPIRLLITDWMMPEMDGLELIKKIRAANMPHYTYILLLTSNDSKGDIVEGLETGADDYLTKPFDKDELVARLGIGERILNLEARLAHMANYDALTGLLNRRALYRQACAALEQAQQDQTPLGLIMLDADHFKSINDTYGHPVGDQVLRMIADLMREVIGLENLIGRWGGEEFLFFLPQADLEQSVQKAEALRGRIADHELVLSDGRKLRLTVSLGANSTSIGAPPFSLDALIAATDEALYCAKAEGRNRVVSASVG